MPPESLPARIPSVTILVVDDQEDHRDLIGRKLKEHGYRVVVAATGDEALGRLDGVDLVLLDYRLPGRTGLETLQLIRQGGGPSAVMVTGLGSETLAVDAMRAGAVDYLVKDHDFLHRLPQVVGRALRHHELGKRSHELQRLVLTVTSASSRDCVFQQVVWGARHLLGADACRLGLFAKRQVIWEAHDGAHDLGLPALVEDTVAASADPDELAEYLTDRLLVPIPSPRGVPLGVLAILTAQPRAYLAEELELATTFAAFAGIAVDKMHQLEAQRALVDDLQAALDLHGRAQEALTHQALHDTLTGLPNRALLVDRLTQAIARSQRTGTDTAVLFLDLDRFKWVNDSLGHTAGDDLLIAVAERLRPQLRPEDTIARFGGDEFVVLCEGLRFGGDAVHTADRLAAALALPFRLGDQPISVTASIGIALASTTPDGSAGEILRDADSAMYRAKEAGRNRIEVFDEGMRLAARARFETEAALRRGIDGDQFKVFYQPIIEMGSERAVGTEALVRWDSGNGNLVASDRFIPLAEETGLIVPIGAVVLREACRQTARWNETICQGQPIMVAVNISPRQLTTGGLVDLVADVLTKSGLPAAQLCLEITETVLMEDASSSEITLAELKRLGVQLAIDDFGTGYSSLRHLRRLPIDVLKIDRSFVAGLGRNAADTAIVNGVAALGRSLGLRTVAEGVEHADQAAMVADLGCEFAQGFLWSKPLPPTDLAHWLHRHTAPARRPHGELLPAAPANASR